jgi:hypothetical protein
MFKLFRIILRRDLMLAFRRKSDLAQVIFFFAVVVTLVPLGVGAETNILRSIAPGVVWVAALLAALLSLPRMFEADHADGTLEQMLVTAEPLPVVVVAKVFAHWLVTGVPMTIFAAVFGILFDLPLDHHGKRLGGDEHLLERAVGMIGLEHARQREKRGEKRGDPHDAGGDRAEDVGFGAHAERHERHDDRKEEDHLRKVGLAAEGEHQVAAEDDSEKLEHDCGAPYLALSASRALSLSSAASTAVRRRGDQRSGSMTRYSTPSTGTS